MKFYDDGDYHKLKSLKNDEAEDALDDEKEESIESLKLRMPLPTVSDVSKKLIS